MKQNNLERMISLVDEVFQTRKDPDQISMNARERDKLTRIHPATLTQETDENGPVAWIMVIPTTRLIMEKFVSGRISERELLEETPLHTVYDALYLCSVLVLPEYRGRGIARRLTTAAVRTIRQDHPLGTLFCWAFTPEGERLARTVAADVKLPLIERAPHSKKS